MLGREAVLDHRHGVGELDLAEAGRFSQSHQTSRLFGARSGETTRHAGIVGVHFWIPPFPGQKTLAAYLVCQVKRDGSIRYVRSVVFRLTAISSWRRRWRE